MRKKNTSVPMTFIGVAVQVRGVDLGIIPYNGKPKIYRWRPALTIKWRDDIEILPLSNKTIGDVLRRAYVALFKLNVT